MPQVMAYGGGNNSTTVDSGKSHGQIGNSFRFQEETVAGARPLWRIAKREGVIYQATMLGRVLGRLVKRGMAL